MDQRTQERKAQTWLVCKFCRYPSDNIIRDIAVTQRCTVLYATQKRRNESLSVTFPVGPYSDLMFDKLRTVSETASRVAQPMKIR